MKVIDVLHEKSEIDLSIENLALLNKDSLINGLKIIKGSLVYYDGSDSLKVNLIDFGIFQDRNYPEFYKEKINKDFDESIEFERRTECSYELSEIDFMHSGLWHIDHFDEWTGKISDYLDHLQSLPSLKCGNITYSPIMFEFNTKTNQLVHFINTLPCKINVNDFIWTIPSMSEISFSSKNKHCTIIPVSHIEYDKIKLKGPISINEDGYLLGYCPENIVIKFRNHPSMKNTVEYPDGTSIRFSNNGIKEIGGYLNKDRRSLSYFEFDLI
jgi:hypothetical protein